MLFDLTQSQEMGMLGICRLMEELHIPWTFTRISNERYKRKQGQRLHWVGSRYHVDGREDAVIEVSLTQPPMGYGWYPVCAKVNLRFFGGTGHRIFRFRYDGRGFSLPRPEICRVDEETAGQHELDWDLEKCHAYCLGHHKAAGGVGFRTDRVI